MSVSMNDVLSQLVAENLLTDAQKQAAAQTLDTTPGLSMPWYIQGLVGMCAWIAALLFIAALSGAGLLISEASPIILGLLFCIIGVGASWAIRRLEYGLVVIFVGQVALASSLAGQVMFIGGIGAITDSVTIAAVTAIILEAILIAVYPNDLHRFISTLVTGAAVSILAYELEVQEVLPLVVILMAGAITAIWLQEAQLIARGLTLYRPVSYGLTLVMFGILCLRIAEQNQFGMNPVITWWVAGIGLFLLTGGLVGYLVWYHNPKLNSMVVLAWAGLSAVVLAGLAWQAVGIVAALLMLGLGVHRTSLILQGLGVAFLVVFVNYYYYNLDYTLLTKSLILLATGAALFGVRWVLLKTWAQPEVQA